MTEKDPFKPNVLYRPSAKYPQISSGRYKGAACEAWREGTEYFFEYDSRGHFLPNFKTVKISKEQFENLCNGDIKEEELVFQCDHGGEQ